MMDDGWQMMDGRSWATLEPTTIHHPPSTIHHPSSTLQRYNPPVARQHEMTRLETFSDAVFAFALTLLVVSLEVPSRYRDLMTLVRGFLPFACCFALFVWIWYEHSAFFSRFGL